MIFTIFFQISLRLNNCVKKNNSNFVFLEHVMDHSLETHLKLLNNLCRLCGKQCLTEKEKQRNIKPVSCKLYSSDIFNVYGHNIATDNELSHSQYTCYKCIKTIGNIKRRYSVVSLQTAKTKFEDAEHIWCLYDRNKTVENCSVCRHRLSFKPHYFSRNTIENDDRTLASAATSEDNDSSSIIHTTIITFTREHN